MRKITLFTFLAIGQLALAQNSYFFPNHSNFNPAIPSPEQFLGYPIGEFHTRHDRIVAYFEKLAEISPLATLQTIGMTYEQRPQIMLTITSRENRQNLEQLREQHLQISDPLKPMPDLDKTPLVIVLGYNVHGNEPSSSEAAMLIAYFLIAHTSEEVAGFRDKAIIHMEPVLNPDGRDRHTNWANMHKGNPKVADPLDREHNEVWPGGRTNHYWFDLNRDWLPLAHVESQARIRFYQNWYPNVGTDYHEMGTNSTYFFEPTKPYGSENPILPRSSYDVLNNVLAPYFVRALDQLGSMYFTKENFDNSYPGYGSTYQDIHGGLGLVFEQASSRGHLQTSTTLDVSFPFTIRNHVATSIATVKGTVENKSVFQNHQREFFQFARNQAAKDPVKARVFGDAHDEGRNRAFLELLLQHKIKVYENTEARQLDGQSFQKGKSWIVPTNQNQYLMVKSVFEHVKTFYDSVFYDASTWTMVTAYGLPNGQLKSPKFSLGKEITELPETKKLFEKASYAYLIDWRDYRTPKALQELLAKGIFVHAAFKPFSIETTNGIQDFSYGTLLVPVSDQRIGQEALHDAVKSAVEKAEVPSWALSSGFSRTGIDLGSGNFRVIQKPRAAMIVGNGVSGYEAGEIWHLLDTRVGMPITKIDKLNLNSLNLFEFNTLVMVNGNYNDLSESFVRDLKAWLNAGNTLIVQKSAVNWAIQKELVQESLIKEEAPAVERMDYVTARDYYGSSVVGGSIYQVDLDITHPLGFGYTNRRQAFYRNSNIFLSPSKNSFATVAIYTSNPWLSGYVKPANLDLIRQSAPIVVSKTGSGRVILMTDNPNFRGYWYGTNKIFLNALFFGSHVTVP